MDRIYYLYRMQMETKTIRVYPTTKDRLDGVGRKGETYDDIINNLLNQAEVGQK
ncbi:MAG: DUF7557 family protein [Nitrososphaera sp.]